MGLITIAVICSIGIAGYFVINSAIQQKIIHQLSNLSPALKTRYSRLTTNLFASSVSFDSLEINFIPYQSMQQYQYRVQVSKFSLKGIHFLKFLFNKDLVANDLVVKNGVICVDSFLLSRNDSLQADILEKINWPFRRLLLRNVDMLRLRMDLNHAEPMVANANILFHELSVDQPGNGPKFESVDMQLSQVNFPVRGFRIDALQVRVNSGKKNIRAGHLQLPSLNGGQRQVLISGVNVEGFDLKKTIAQDSLVASSITANGIKAVVNRYNIEINRVELNNEKKIGKATGINIFPQLGKYELGRKLGHQADWIAASIPAVHVIKPQIEKWLMGKLQAEKVTVNELRAYVFRDRRLPRLQTPVPLPVDYLEQLPVDIRVDSLDLVNGRVEYEEFPRSGFNKTGVLRIEQMNAIRYPLINHPRFSDSSFITMNLHGSIMGSGNSNCVAMMPLKKTERIA